LLGALFNYLFIYYNNLTFCVYRISLIYYVHLILFMCYTNVVCLRAPERKFILDIRRFIKQIIIIMLGYVIG